MTFSSTSVEQPSQARPSLFQDLDLNQASGVQADTEQPVEDLEM
jgi:hypothetical protein